MMKRYTKHAVCLSLFFSLTASSVAGPLKVEDPLVDQKYSNLLVEARDVATLLALKLRVALKERLATHGPAHAVAACNEAAPDITKRTSLEKGWKVTRVSLKPRNSLLGTPDAWEQKVLLDFEERKKNGLDVESIELVEVVTEPQGRYFRYMKAIPAQPTCMICHGDSQRISPEIKDFLTKNYPGDKATGYSPGDIRGAVSVKVPLAK